MGPSDADICRKFEERFRPLYKSVSKDDLRKETGISDDKMRWWGSQRGTSWQVPNIVEALRVARFFDRRAAWLAFGELPEADELFEGEQQVLDALRRFEAPPYDTVLAMLRSLPLPRKPERPLLPAATTTKVRVVQPMKRLRRINRRDDLPRYYLSSMGKGLPVHGYRGLAAGPGRDLERSPDLLYVRELPSPQGYTYARVAGESMLDTIRVGDRILLKHRWGEKGLELPPRGNNPKNDMYRLKSEVPEDSICILSVDDDFPTLKRVHYDITEGVADWRLVIKADNPSEWPDMHVRKTQSVKFYAQFVGLLEVE